jgi:AraC-like DNA-binding protein
MWTRDAEDATVTGDAQGPMTEGETVFLQKVSDLVLSHLEDTDFTTGGTAADLGISRMQLNRRLQALTGHSAHEVFRHPRLQKAARLLAARAGAQERYSPMNDEGTV